VSLADNLNAFDNTTKTVAVVVIAGVVLWAAYEVYEYFHTPSTGDSCEPTGLASPQSVGVLAGIGLVGLALL
jgi:hypothetical protein